MGRQDSGMSRRRREEDEELPPGWERRESDIRPGQFYYSNPSTRQVALTVEEARRDHDRKQRGDDGKRKSAWDQREAEAKQSRGRAEEKMSKLLNESRRSAWDQRR